jgi:nucleoside-diphosphate-sugar epimerase
MNISIIGGSGFIGKRLCDILSDSDNKFKILDKNVNDFYKNKTCVCDVRNLNSVISSIDQGSIIINLAAEHQDNVLPVNLYYDVNVIGAENICIAARAKGVKKIIFTSSVAVYGFSNEEITESSIINPINDYGKSKYEAELVFKRWQEEDQKNRSLIIIRPTVVIGEGNRGNFYRLISLIYSGKFIMIGNGRNVKSIAYVGNLSYFLNFCLSSFSEGIYIFNYVDKPDMRIIDLISLVRSAMNSKIKHNKFDYFIMFIFKRVFIPYCFAIFIGKFFDILSLFLNTKFGISKIRIIKFCNNSMFTSNYVNKYFKAPIKLEDAIVQTINYEFFNEKK